MDFVRTFATPAEQNARSTKPSTVDAAPKNVVAALKSAVKWRALITHDDPFGMCYRDCLALRTVFGSVAFRGDSNGQRERCINWMMSFGWIGVLLGLLLRLVVLVDLLISKAWRSTPRRVIARTDDRRGLRPDWFRRRLHGKGASDDAFQFG